MAGVKAGGILGMVEERKTINACRVSHALAVQAVIIVFPIIVATVEITGIETGLRKHWEI